MNKGGWERWGVCVCVCGGSGENSNREEKGGRERDRTRPTQPDRGGHRGWRESSEGANPDSGRQAPAGSTATAWRLRTSKSAQAASTLHAVDLGSLAGTGSVRLAREVRDTSRH